MNKKSEQKITTKHIEKLITKPKMYLSKYLNKVKINKYDVAFLKGRKSTELHTAEEWGVIVKKELNRKLV